ncbi:MAG: NADH ubiquinone oxidoreductase 20 kDa subunit [Gammaproteobacteria bacterium]|nr:MAG: NADH ubiquinone oxidoreductase 20 kDa subunit [Gammaproteobacteria bacterium]TND02131.1 MAG: NADH ubiquinone oxidoreductase 20 kDa subunit [Gammaproteobacteria bacterium]
MNPKPKIAVHKFASCDGCQLAFLNAGEKFLELAQLVEIVHFVEAGMVAPDRPVDIAFIEGSISTPEHLDHIRAIRGHSRFLVTIGACATAGGIQALRNLADADEWIAGVYAQPRYIRSLATSTPVSHHVKVDFELWGCPVNTPQVMAAIRQLLFGVMPVDEHDKVCMDCKRSQTVCVMVTQGVPCMGPVTRTGCGAICPRFGRDCYACYGPAENANSLALGRRFEGLGLMPDAVARRFLFINNAAPVFAEAGRRWSGADD